MDVKERILEFLKKNSGKKFNVSEIARELNINYTTALKWVEVLIAENSLKVIDLGNAKVVWYE